MKEIELMMKDRSSVYELVERSVKSADAARPHDKFLHILNKLWEYGHKRPAMKQESQPLANRRTISRSLTGMANNWGSTSGREKLEAIGKGQGVMKGMTK